MAPVAGVLLLAITVVLAGGVAAAALGPSTATVPPSAVLSLSATDDRIAIDHRGGDPIDVAAVTVRVSVDGEPLDTNDPTLEPGRTVTVEITADGRPVATLEASVEAG